MTRARCSISCFNAVGVHRQRSDSFATLDRTPDRAPCDRDRPAGELREQSRCYRASPTFAAGVRTIASTTRTNRQNVFVRMLAAFRASADNFFRRRDGWHASPSRPVQTTDSAIAGAPFVTIRNTIRLADVGSHQSPPSCSSATPVCSVLFLA